MKEKILTCPFTGIEFTATELADGKLVFTHPLTGEQLQMNWNSSINRYKVPKGYFRHIETMTREQVQKALEVSHQRVTQIIANETIPVHIINGTPMFLAEDVYDYKDNRKVGAPRKAV